MAALDTNDKDESVVPNFKTSRREKIRRVVVFFAVILLALDIGNLVQVVQMSCFDVVSPLFQGFATICIDILLVLVYSPKRTEYSRTKNTLTNLRSSYGGVIWRSILLLLTLIWPIREIITTGQITQPVDNNCEENISSEISLGRVVNILADGPGVLDLIQVLKVARARTSVCVAVCIFMVVELALAYNNQRMLIRRDKALAKRTKGTAMPTTDIELSAVEGRV